MGVGRRGAEQNYRHDPVAMARIEERLYALRERVPPLWIEILPPERALRELGRREGLVFDLQRARFLLELGREEEAGAVLKDLAPMPPGAAQIREGLLARLSCPADFAYRDLGLDGPGGEVPEFDHNGGERPWGPGGARAALEEWLSRVRGWREALGA